MSAAGRAADLPDPPARPPSEAAERQAVASAATGLRGIVQSMRAFRRFDDEASHFERWIARHGPGADR
ncbi:MAG: hypothetical protein RJA99_155 [Pseudomonadota bacterium]|jgi:hypothetical protein